MLDEKQRQSVLRRLKIVRGQVEGIERMVTQDKYCVDVLTQISAVHEALRGVGKVIVGQHLETCVARDIKKGKGDHHYSELLDIIYKLSK